MKDYKFDVVFLGPHGDQRIAEFKYDKGLQEYSFIYDPKATFEFPGFPKEEKVFFSKTLFEPLAFRVPNFALYKLGEGNELQILSETEGRLATDHFALLPKK